MNSENSRAAATPLVRSAATARPIAMPAPPVAPWTNRQPVRPGAEVASAHSTEASAHTTVVPTSSRCRPQASDSGPATSCPTTSPITSAVRVSCTPAADVPRSVARCGNAGRYRSIDSGPKAANPASSTVTSASRRCATGATA